LIEQIAALANVPERDLSEPSMLHLTLLMLDFTNEPERLSKAKVALDKLRPSLISEFLGGGSKPIYLKFDGLKTFADAKPENTKVLFFDVVQDESYERLQKLNSRIITEFLEQGIVT
jgi:hypothetical protein